MADEITAFDVDLAEISFELTCEFCSNIFSEYLETLDYQDSKEEIAFKLNKSGWGMLDSEEYQMIGVACPNCLDNHDTEE